MTIIAAAYRDPTDYAIGSDTLACSGGGARIVGVEKVWRAGAVLVGASGAWAQVQRVRAALGEPNDGAGLVAAVAAMRPALLAHTGAPGFGQLGDTLVELLTVGPWGIVEFDGIGGWTIHSGSWAIGSGGSGGQGAMHALRSCLDCYAPRLLVEAAVRAAIALDTGCGGEPVVLRGPG